MYDFEPTEEQKALAAAAREFCKKGEGNGASTGN